MEMFQELVDSSRDLMADADGTNNTNRSNNGARREYSSFLNLKTECIHSP